MFPSSHTSFGVRLFLLVWLLPIWFVGCDTGSRGTKPTVTGDLSPGEPRLSEISPTTARAGDEITLIGWNFALDPALNEVVFEAADGSDVTIPGQVTRVETVGTSGLDTATELTVRLPTGMRNSRVSLRVVKDGVLAPALVQTGTDVCSALEIVGLVYGNDNRGWIDVDLIGNVTPDSVIVYGYNLDLVTSATFVDEGANALSTNMVIPGLPLGALVTLPPGMDAVTIELPNGLVITDCTDVAAVQLTVTGACPNDGSLLTSQTVDVRFRKSVGGSPGEVPATVSGCFVAPGVHAGDILLTFSLLAEPSMEAWSVSFEYEYPSGSGLWLPCTAAIPESASGLLAGVSEHPSNVAGILGPGHVHEFVWASGVDLAGESGSTRVRIAPQPSPNSPYLCFPSTHVSEHIAFDNEGLDPMTGEGSDVWIEEFENDRFRGENPNGLVAEWDLASGQLLGTGLPATSGSLFGNGTVDIVLESGRSYEIFTDAVDIVDVTEVGMPINLLPASLNPGESDQEFHVRTFVVEAEADVILLGSQPLVIRCSGTGQQTAIVFRVDGTLDLSGQDGTEGEQAGAGVGGSAVLGGGDGGDGASLDTLPAAQMITSLVHATPGGGFGGEAGASITFAEPGLATSQPRGGGGGGGGHSARGEAGLNSNANFARALPGRGGRARGDASRLLSTAGGGGGGGGAATFRSSPNNSALQGRHGGGGGGGGGSIDVFARGSIVVSGDIWANGGAGAKGEASGSAGAGGGGAGGGIGLFADGAVIVTDTGSVLARGGPSVANSNFGGGAGSDGRIRFEATRGVRMAGLVDFSALEPALGVPHVSVASDPEDVNTGTGADGVLDLSGTAGTYLVDTNNGTILDPQGQPFLAQPSVLGGGEFHWERLVIPSGVELRARGNQPLIFRVSGSARVAGRIDVSGEPGSIPDFTDPSQPLVAAGGAPGPGGGAGGLGGVGSEPPTAGESGQLPPLVPMDLDGTLALYNAIGLGGGALPDPVILPAQGGVSVSADCVVCDVGSGGGGGYALAGEAGQGPGVFLGGNAFGTAGVDHPTTGLPLPLGGTGGAGGGGNHVGFGPGVAHTPGTGGGGAGGYFELAVGGTFLLEPTAELLACGGDSYRAPEGAGNGGGGAGGAVVLRVFGQLLAPSPGPTIRTTGGRANVDPPTATYSPNDKDHGGDGAPGRIRIESLSGFHVGGFHVGGFQVGGFQVGATTNCDQLLEDEAGVCPVASLGELFRATAPLSRLEGARRPVASASGLVTMGSRFGATTQTPSASEVLPNTVVLFEGYVPDADRPGFWRSFGEPTTDPSELDGASFLRMSFYLFGVPLQGGATVQPVLDQVRVPVEF